jgi:hypothetical protein
MMDIGKTRDELLEELRRLRQENIQLKSLYEIHDNEKVLAQNKFRMLFEQSPVGMALVLHETGEFLEVNNSVLESTGYTKEEFLNVMRNKFIQKVGSLTSTSVDGVNRGKSSTSCDLNSVDCLSTVDLVDGILTVSIIEPPEYELIRQAHNAHYLSKQEQTNENSDDK